MGTVSRGLLKSRWQLQLQFVRNRTKVSITKPRPPHYERALMEQVCLPFFTKQKKPSHLPDIDKCKGSRVKKRIVKEHPLTIIQAKEYSDIFHNSKLLALFHVNFLDKNDEFEYKLEMKKNGFKVVFPGKLTVQKALSGTIYETVLSLFEAPVAVGYCKECKLHTLVSILKKMPKFVLMGVIAENKLLSLSEVNSYGAFKNLTEARLSLQSALNKSSLSLVQKINYHPSNFVALLNERKKLLNETVKES